MSTYRRHLLPTSLLLLVSPTCVSVVEIDQVEIAVNIPCAPWNDADNALAVQVVRGVEVSGSCSATVSCSSPAEHRAAVRCDQSAVILLDMGDLPEIVAVEAVDTTGQWGVALVEVTGPGTYPVILGPGFNDGGVEEPCDAPVLGCVHASDVTIPCGTPAPPTPTPTPSPDPSPSATPAPTSTAPSSTPSTSPTAATATP